MLVLSRRKSESIWIGENVRITVVKVDRHQVRLGIEAPPEIPIIREEILADSLDDGFGETSEAETLDPEPALAGR